MLPWVLWPCWWPSEVGAPWAPWGFSPLRWHWSCRGTHTHLHTSVCLNTLTSKQSLSLNTVQTHTANHAWDKDWNKQESQNVCCLDTDCRKKETKETLTTRRSNKLNQFLQNEPWWRNAPWTVICEWENMLAIQDNLKRERRAWVSYFIELKAIFTFNRISTVKMEVKA